MSTALLLLAGSVDEAALEDAFPAWDASASAAFFSAYRADDDPLAETPYGAKWPYTAVVSLDDAGGELGQLPARLSRMIDSLGSLIDRSSSTVVVGTTFRIIDDRTDVALVYAIHRLPGTTNEQYREHWRQRHGPLAKELVPTRGYEQLHTDLVLSTRLNRDLGFDDAAYDGVATCFFDTREHFASMLAGRESEGEASAVYQDELRFLDHDRSFGAMVRVAHVEDPAP
jgi:hypothetical protein